MMSEAASPLQNAALAHSVATMQITNPEVTNARFFLSRPTE